METEAMGRNLSSDQEQEERAFIMDYARQSSTELLSKSPLTQKDSGEQPPVQQSPIKQPSAVQPKIDLYEGQYVPEELRYWQESYQNHKIVHKDFVDRSLRWLEDQESWMRQSGIAIKVKPDTLINYPEVYRNKKMVKKDDWETIYMYYIDQGVSFLLQTQSQQQSKSPKRVPQKGRSATSGETEKPMETDKLQAPQPPPPELAFPELQDFIQEYKKPEARKKRDDEKRFLNLSVKIRVDLNRALFLFFRDRASMNDSLQTVAAASYNALDYDDRFYDDVQKEHNVAWEREIATLAERCQFWAGRHMYEVGLKYIRTANRKNAGLALKRSKELFMKAENYHTPNYGGKDCDCDMGGSLHRKWYSLANQALANCSAWEYK